MLARAVVAGMGVEGVRCVYGGSAWWVVIVYGVLVFNW